MTVRTEEAENPDRPSLLAATLTAIVNEILETDELDKDLALKEEFCYLASALASFAYLACQWGAAAQSKLQEEEIEPGDLVAKLCSLAETNDLTI